MPRETLSAHALLNKLHQRARFIDGQRVILDKDAAEVYGISVGVLRRTVAKNKVRFLGEVLFQLKGKESRYAFTEEGILLLSSIINTPQAIQTSIEIIRDLFSFRSN